jgi:hypothetical protein
MRVKSVLVLGLCLLATGCVTNWEPVYGPVPQTAASNEGRTVRLIMQPGMPTVEMENMRVEGDSIVGEAGNPPQRIAVATADVRVITLSRIDNDSPINTTIRTVGIIILVAVVGSLIAFMELIDAIEG